MTRYTLRNWNGFTTAIHLKLSDPPTPEEIRELARDYRMRERDVRSGLLREETGQPVWGRARTSRGCESE